ncbi:hypothetical protein [Nocardioides alcanivorans]|uniref:hypothetical protein n=1 Tax=Nocardioides alcanivorans TaxID=2897352 RepID=UPI00289E03E5|nr:hypothetical protein [Nocardioides alcanivorans]
MLEGAAGGFDGVVEGEVAAGAAGRRGPLAVDVDETDAVGLEPAQDRLGLLRRGGGDGAGTVQDGLGLGPESVDEDVGVGSRGITPAAARRP